MPKDRGIRPKGLRVQRDFIRRVFPFGALALIVLVGLVWLSMQPAFGLRSFFSPDLKSADATSHADAGTLSSSEAMQIPAVVLPASGESSVHADEPLLILCARSGGYRHLVTYAFLSREMGTLAAGEWDDIDPAISPDGSRLAFASNRDGQWDLYLLSLESGDVSRLTDTAAYEGHPTWSPDGTRLAFESSEGNGFDLWILGIHGEATPLQLTGAGANEYSPSWSPSGDEIAFVSEQDGSYDIWIIGLDESGGELRNLTQSPHLAKADPSFSPGGSWLAYSESRDGLALIMLRNIAQTSAQSLEVGQGGAATWSPDGQTIAAIFNTPHSTHLVSYAFSPAGLISLGEPTVRGLCGLSWLPNGGATLVRASPAWEAAEDLAATEAAPIFREHMDVVKLQGVAAPLPYLSDAVDEAFQALRERAAQLLGWDFLATLEHAFVGLNDAMPPGFALNDWLYTGRAFAFSEAALRAGWIEIVKEEVGQQTYWRVFARTKAQDGSAGQPLRLRPWDLAARSLENPSDFEDGGALQPQMPSGFFIDFTELAADFGFARVPAYPNWRTYFPGARYNEFVRSDGLSWEEAMLQLYPTSALATPTRIPPTETPQPSSTSPP
jgi:TolB protein